jgi:HAD superfamily hydrolase (TIGR01509 family)
MKVKFIYFDVGGVVVKDFSCTNKWEEMKQALGIDESKDKQFEDIWTKYEPERCISSDVDNLVPVLNQQLGLNLDPNHSMLNEFVSRFEANKDLWPILKSLKKNYGLGLLTNMYPRMLNHIQKSGLLPPIGWDVVIDSSVEKCQKPDERIFEIAKARTGLMANEILFVENSDSHLEAAKKLGWQVFKFDSCDYEGSNESLNKLLRGRVD